MALQIECVDVAKRFGTTRVLDRLNWTITAGLVGLLGESGTGKTTLLRLMAGLEACSSGGIIMSQAGSDGPNRRPPIGMVFQNLALWPHLSARRHVECVLRGLGRAQRRHRVEALLAEMQLPRQLWNRRPAELSGGEAQRLALARALAPEPQLLLLDEPLAQLDTPLRGAMLDSMREAIRARGLSAVYVTHHWREAMETCQRIAVLDGGRIATDATPEELFWNPPTARIARLTGPVVELPEPLLDEGLVAWAEPPPAVDSTLREEPDRLLVRPQQVRVGPPEDKNRWTVQACRPAGVGWTLRLVHEGRRLSIASPAPRPPGQTVAVQLCSATAASLC